jgi:hypothetical protein
MASLRLLLPAGLFALLSACVDAVTIDAAPPAASGDYLPPAIPPLSQSVIDAPISLSLGPTLAALESAVPTTFGDIDVRIRNRSNTRQQFAYEATRSRFDVALDDGLLTLGTTVTYAGKGWYNAPLLPEVGASCGIDTERPRLRARVQSTIGLSEQWTLRTRTRLASLRPVTDTDRDACRVTAFSIDVTDRVAGAVRGILQKELPRIDRKLRDWNVRDRLDGWYNAMNKPIHVGDSLWLLLRPGDVRLGAMNVNDTAVVFDVRLYASPVIVSGAEPAHTHVPLPPLREAVSEVGDSARVLLEASIQYDVATAMLRERLVGRSFRRWSRRVRIVDVRLVPVGDGRVALGLRFDGALRGEGWLVGTPVLDVPTEQLTVPDLDFDVATGDALVRGLEFLRTDAVLSQLRESAVLPLGERLDALRVKVEGAINRDLADGVALSARLRTGRLLDVVAMPSSLIVRAEAAGSLALGIDRELSFRAP